MDECRESEWVGDMWVGVESVRGGGCIMGDMEITGLYISPFANVQTKVLYPINHPY